MAALIKFGHDSSASAPPPPAASASPPSSWPGAFLTAPGATPCGISAPPRQFAREHPWEQRYHRQGLSGGEEHWFASERCPAVNPDVHCPWMTADSTRPRPIESRLWPFPSYLTFRIDCWNSLPIALTQNELQWHFAILRSRSMTKNKHQCAAVSAGRRVGFQKS